jgi:hypothetical protein
MTEAQWLTTTRTHVLLTGLGETASARKLRLLAVACCRLIPDILYHPRWFSAVEAAELYADGLISGPELDAARFRPQLVTPYGNEGAAVAACSSVLYFAAKEVCAHARAAARTPTRNAEQANLVRDIFGNPFRPVAFDPAWRTDTAVALARQMYDSREFGAMPILADALQDAGCEDEQVLSHCRGTNHVHVRGCWVCDLVLGLA